MWPTVNDKDILTFPWSGIATVEKARNKKGENEGESKRELSQNLIEHFNEKEKNKMK